MYHTSQVYLPRGHASIAQVVEQQTENLRVGGANPSRGTKSDMGE